MTDFWWERRVLVTGGAGFLGAHLCRTLADRGAAVVSCDRVDTSPGWRVLGLEGRVELLKRDCANWVNILYALQGDGRHPLPTGEVVFHLAGLSHIRAAQEAPVAAVEANVLGAAGVLEACRQYREQGGRLRALVVASSNHVFAGGRRGRGLAFAESDALNPGDTYGATKGCADLLTRAYAVGYGLPAVALRHANAYGPADPHASHLVPATILSLLRGEAPAVKSDGTPKKGYIFVDDLISAYLRAAELLADGARPEVLNVGGTVTSVLALVHELVDVSGLGLAPEVRATDPSQSGYVEILDDARFRALGWQPRVPLREGLEKTWAWYQANGGMEWAK